jgi:hypothetical protein
MKSFISLLLGLCLSAPLFAQQDTTAQKFPPEELDKLVSPIALYPDSLVALILPSSTTSSDVVLAARFLADNGDPSAIDNQPWSDSVKSLAHYPEVVKWMDENLSWTRQMGDVFEAQPADVMTAIQRMRAQARAAGLLTDTPQQKVVTQDEEIYIEPAQPNVIYVPVYDPEVLWMRRPYHGSFISFGIGFGVGNWLFYDCDWRSRGIWVQHRTPGWVYRPGWRRSDRDVHVVVGAPWRPDPRRNPPGRPMHQPVPVAVHPRMMGDPRHDQHGRPDSRPDRPVPHNDDRPGRVVDPAHGRSAPMPTQHAVPPPPQAGRPHQEVAPQTQPPREHRMDNNRSSPQTPRPPSHTPVTPPAPPPQAHTQRPGGGAPAGGIAPAPARATPPSPAPKPSSKDNDDKKQGGPGGRDNNRK